MLCPVVPGPAAHDTEGDMRSNCPWASTDADVYLRMEGALLMGWQAQRRRYIQKYEPRLPCHQTLPVVSRALAPSAHNCLAGTAAQRISGESATQRNHH